MTEIKQLRQEVNELRERVARLEAPVWHAMFRDEANNPPIGVPLDRRTELTDEQWRKFRVAATSSDKLINIQFPDFPEATSNDGGAAFDWAALQRLRKAQEQPVYWRDNGVNHHPV